MAATRRLAAILAADVAGYSRLMGADEEGTHERLQAHLRDFMDPKIKEHHGRIVKNTGDGFPAEFASAWMQCAAQLRSSAGWWDREPEVPEDRRIRFRIGVNLGDVMAGHLWRRGQVAARLEGLAEPGGICVSARVQEDAAGKLDLAFEDIGDKHSRTSSGRCGCIGWQRGWPGLDIDAADMTGQDFGGDPRGGGGARPCLQRACAALGSKDSRVGGGV